VPACYTANAVWSVGFSAAAMFGLELTVGVSWAVTLDIGGAYAGSVSSVMNRANCLRPRHSGPGLVDSIPHIVLPSEQLQF
jgi:hypothetical protein